MARKIGGRGLNFLKETRAILTSSNTIIFSKVAFKGNIRQKEINEIANLAFISGKMNRQITNQEPMEYLEKEVIAKRGKDALLSQLIPTDKKLWEISSFRNFLDYRRRAIANEINDFMQKFN